MKTISISENTPFLRFLLLNTSPNQLQLSHSSDNPTSVETVRLYTEIVIIIISVQYIFKILYMHDHTERSSNIPPE